MLLIKVKLLSDGHTKCPGITIKRWDFVLFLIFSKVVILGIFRLKIHMQMGAYVGRLKNHGIENLFFQ